MNAQERDQIAGAVCEFYDVDMGQVRGTGRTPAVVIARCALATELDAAGEAVSTIAFDLQKTDVSVRAMIEQYEARAITHGLPLFVTPGNPEASEPAGAPAPEKGIALIDRMVLDKLLTDVGGARIPASGDTMPPLFGLTALEAQAIAVKASSEYDIDSRTIAEFFDVHVRKVADWISQADDATAMTAPAQDSVDSDDAGQPPSFGLDEARLGNGIEAEIESVATTESAGISTATATAKHTGRLEIVLPVLDEQLPGDPPPASNLLNYIDRADLYAIAQFMVTNLDHLPAPLNVAVHRILLCLVDAVFDVLPTSDDTE